jgi:hypothetical protein
MLAVWVPADPRSDEQALQIARHVAPVEAGRSVPANRFQSALDLNCALLEIDRGPLQAQHFPKP